MEEYIVELVKQMKVGNIISLDDKMRCGDEMVDVTYHTIESDEATLRFWNCSGDTKFVSNLSYVLDDIRTAVMDEDTGGTVHDGFNEVMWEII